jgi:hypothetical protein
MIAVLAKPSEHAVVREFFELFKTPWEFYRPGVDYEVVLCSESGLPMTSARLIVWYQSSETSAERENGVATVAAKPDVLLCYGASRMPIYGPCLTFCAEAAPALKLDGTQTAVAHTFASDSRTVVRVGFDLFDEVQHLLTQGQPPVRAGIPALDLHILFLRELITSVGIPLVEVPPVPAGYKFAVCLTHDVDHVGVRNHMCDHTMFGFLYRATVGTFIDTLRSRKSFRQLALNWWAALSLPLVHLGLVKDFWYQFDHYLEIEKDLASTFFVIPRKGDPGQEGEPRRAASYEVRDIADHLRRIMAAGSEVAVHGIDAWRDSVKGREELELVSRLTGSTELGVRMHWLYFKATSHTTLEQAGFSFDSTVGYNQTVGYRAGTTQAFKPLEAEHLLELPMHIMDTALFYPIYLNLSPNQAQLAIRPLVEHAAQFGGALTVNWHDRSIAPERLWEEPYVALVQDCKNNGAWFPTASQAVAWFRMRRSAKIESVAWADDSVRIKVRVDDPNQGLPSLRMRIHRPVSPPGNGSELSGARDRFVDLAFNQTGELKIDFRN